MNSGNTTRLPLRERLAVEESAITSILAILRTQKLSTERRYDLLNDLAHRERVRKRLLKAIGVFSGR